MQNIAYLITLSLACTISVVIGLAHINPSTVLNLRSTMRETREILDTVMGHMANMARVNMVNNIRVNNIRVNNIRVNNIRVNNIRVNNIRVNNIRARVIRARDIRRLVRRIMVTAMKVI